MLELGQRLIGMSEVNGAVSCKNINDVLGTVCRSRLASRILDMSKFGKEPGWKEMPRSYGWLF